MSPREFATALASELSKLRGETWTVPPATQEWHERHPHVARTDGASFWMSGGPGDAKSYQNAKGAWSVHPEWPKDATGQEHRPYFSQWNGKKSPGISFAGTSTPERAAKEINRRFLPDYLPLFEEENTRAKGSDSYRAEMLDLATKVALLLGGEVKNANARELPMVWLGYREKGIAEVKLGSNSEVRFEVRGTFETLRKVAELLK